MGLVAADRARRIRTKSIRLSDEEQRLVELYLEITGEVEATFLKRAAMRGVREEMLERGLMAFIAGTNSSVAAQMAGVDRQTFLNALIEHKIPMTDESPDDMLDNLLRTSSDFGNDRLRQAVMAVQARRGDELSAPPGHQ
jgi:hypothetical protein